MAVYYSPMGQIKRKIRNSTRGLAISTGLMLIFNLITNILLITAAIAVYGTSIPGYTFNDFIIDYVEANLFQMLYLLPTLAIALAVLIFFILMATGFRSLGKTLQTSQIRSKLQQTSTIDEPLGISSTAGSTFQRAGSLFIIGIITSFVGGIILGFVETFATALASDVLGIVVEILYAFSYFFIVVAFRELKRAGEYPRNMKLLIFFAQIGIVTGMILQVVGSNIEFNTGLIITIVAVVVSLTGNIFYIIGLFKLGNDTQDIKDTAAPAYPVAPYAPAQPVYSAETAVTESRFCSYCGNQVQLTDKFCMECGRNITDQ